MTTKIENHPSKKYYIYYTEYIILNLKKITKSIFCQYVETTETRSANFEAFTHFEAFLLP